MASLLLRGVSLGAKFLLLLVMARYLPFADIGRYGLAVATVNIMSRLAGAEFYTVTNRDLVTAPVEERWRIVNGLLRVVATGLSLSIGVCWLVSRKLDLGVGWGVLALILVAHQIGTETSRILIAVGRPIQSYLVNALLHGVWPLVLIGVWVAAPGDRSLSSVWWAWLIGGALGAGWGVREVVLAFGSPWRAGAPGAAWFQHGLQTAGFFLVSAAAYRAIEFADRFIVQGFFGTAAVGVYTYYATFAKLTIELPTVLVVSPMFPEVVGVMRNGRTARARSVLSVFTWRCVVWAVLSLPVLFGGLWVAGRVLGRDAIWKAPGAYLALLAGGVLLAASQGGHYALYGAGRERQIAAITAAAAGANIIIGLALTPFLGMLGAAFGTLGAMAIMAIGKAVAGTRAVSALSALDVSIT